MKVVIVAALLLLAPGCSVGSNDAADEAAVQTSTENTAPAVPAPSSPYPGAGTNCPAGEPSPITVNTARATLHEHGFTVAKAEGWCGLELISAMLTNASASPHTGQVMRREGLLYCYLLVAPRPLGGAENLVAGDTLAASAERRLANLDCDLYGAEKKGFDKHVFRLDEALDDFRQRLDRE